MSIRTRKSRLEIIQEEIEDCNTILESAYIERDIALIIGEIGSLSDINGQINAMHKRLKALKTLLEKAEHPETISYNEDFIGYVVIKPKGMQYGEKRN